MTNEELDMHSCCCFNHCRPMRACFVVVCVYCRYAGTDPASVVRRRAKCCHSSAYMLCCDKEAAWCGLMHLYSNSGKSSSTRSLQQARIELQPQAAQAIVHLVQ
eukprot:9969-Heterococcus_DN1.PRE.2